MDPVLTKPGIARGILGHLEHKRYFVSAQRAVEGAANVASEGMTWCLATRGEETKCSVVREAIVSCRRPRCANRALSAGSRIDGSAAAVQRNVQHSIW